MKNKILLLITTLFISTAAISQITFDKGYYVDNSGTRHDGLIKNRGWNNNPRQFEFKSDAASAEVIKTINDITEFSVDGQVKYVRADVDMDRSTNNLEHLSDVKTPTMVNERILVRALVEGTESLYVYNESGLERFFFKDNSGSIKQLIYKKYAMNASQVGENTMFRNQLWNEVRCANTEMNKVENLKYNDQQLIIYFKEVNNCNGSDTSSKIETTKKKGSFNVKASLGYSKMEFSTFNLDASKSNPSFGAEFEYILPTNRNKWGILVEPTYNSFSGEKGSASITYNFIETTAGVRHYMFLNPESKFFLTLGLSTSIATETESSPYTIADFTYKIGAGFGYQYKRIAAEVKLYRNHGILTNDNVENEFKKISFMLRYTIFK